MILFRSIICEEFGWREWRRSGKAIAYIEIKGKDQSATTWGTRIGHINWTMVSLECIQERIKLAINNSMIMLNILIFFTIII